MARYRKDAHTSGQPAFEFIQTWEGQTRLRKLEQHVSFLQKMRTLEYNAHRETLEKVRQLESQLLDIKKENSNLKIKLLEARNDGQAKPDSTGIETALFRKILTRLVAITHPDKWGGHPCAEELTKALLETRTHLASKGAPHVA